MSVTQVFYGTVGEAESCWYDASAWPLWVDGLDRVLKVDSAWPSAGAAVTWESGPAGRGRVVERVTAHEPGEGQTLEIEDASIRGRQQVTFTAAEASTELAPQVHVVLTLEYELARRSLLTPIVDALFIRRAMTASLQATVSRFGVQLAAVRDGRRAPEP